MSAFLGAFLSVANLLNIALSVSVIGILGVGMTAVILTGGIDLSVGSGVALTGVVAAMAATAMVSAHSSSLAVVAALGAAFVVGAGGGLLTGITVARLGVPPFLITLALFSIERG